MQLETYVRSFANGRMRVRHPALVGLDGEERQAIEAMVMAVNGVTSVSFNPSVGSALLLWDPLRLDVETMKDHLQGWLEMVEAGDDSALEEGTHAPQSEGCSLATCAKEALEPAKKIGQTALDSVAKAIVPDVKNTKRARRMAQNRIMLGLGSASVASLVFNKTGHGYLGWGFAAFVLLHLWQHRRVL